MKLFLLGSTALILASAIACETYRSSVGEFRTTGSELGEITRATPDIPFNHLHQWANKVVWATESGDQSSGSYDRCLELEPKMREQTADIQDACAIVLHGSEY